MRKIKLYAIGNQNDFNYYVFDKTRDVHKILNKLFSDVFDIRWPLKEERFGDNDEVELIKTDISKNKDFHEKIHGFGVREKAEKGRIDVFYGGKKIFVVIHCSLKYRKKFNDKSGKVAIIPKPKK